MKRMVRTFMHGHPRGDRGLASVMAMLAPIVLVLVVALTPLHVGGRASIAAIGPLVVLGFVDYTSGGAPVSGATVVVTIYDGLTPGAQQSTVTDPSGYYTVTFANGEWNVGNTVQVTASKGADSGSNSVVTTDEFPVQIDVNIGTAIPEINGPVMTALTVSAAGLMVVFIARRRGSGSQ